MFPVRCLGFEFSFYVRMGATRFGSCQPEVVLPHQPEVSFRAERIFLYQVAAKMEELTMNGLEGWVVVVDHDGLHIELATGSRKEAEVALTTLQKAANHVAAHLNGQALLERV